jgi:hypothetical protein
VQTKGKRFRSVQIRPRLVQTLRALMHVKTETALPGYRQQAESGSLTKVG